MKERTRHQHLPPLNGFILLNLFVINNPIEKRNRSSTSVPPPSTGALEFIEGGDIA